MTTSPDNETDMMWMQAALKEAKSAASRGEVPIGAVIVADNTLIGCGSNSPIQSNDPTSHAEIVALRQAGKRFGNYRMPESTLYVTLEPCVMCIGAILLARIKRVVYGADDPKSGAVVSKYTIGTDNRLNHTIEVTGGILKDECGQLLTSFFKAKRKKANKDC